MEEEIKKLIKKYRDQIGQISTADMYDDFSGLEINVLLDVIDDLEKLL